VVKERLKVKHFADVSIVDNIILLDEQVRKLKVESETLQATMNAASNTAKRIFTKLSSPEFLTEQRVGRI